MKTIATAILIATVVTGCVSRGKFERAVAQTEVTRAVMRKELAGKDAQLVETREALAQRDAELARLKTEIDQLERLSKASSGDASASRSRLQELQKRLLEVESARKAAEGRAALYKELTLRLKKQIDDGDLAVVLRDGRMVLQLPNDVLFDTGRTELKPAGKAALEAVADLVKAMPNRQFQVAGHTDNVPIKNDRFASNWELSSARALRVVHFLIGAGAPARSLSAAGYAEVDPVGSNEAAEGRKLNRRTEISLQPDIGELVRLP